MSTHNHPIGTSFQETKVARKYKGNMNGQKYVANTSPYRREVHDLDNENRNCQVDEIIRSGQDMPYTSLDAARRDDFGQCAFCSEGSNR
ncbi:MAG: hypothetical protein ACRENK_02755 [Gemmatimonadaceae bacterium]